MTWGLTSTTSLPLGTRPLGTPVGSALTGTIKVMAIGDSITKGLGDPIYNSYRKNLHTLATAAGMTLSWVGDVSDGDPPSNLHQGYSGSTLVDHMSTGTYDTPTAISTHQPDVAIVFLGTNDAADEALTTNFATNYTTLMNELETAHPGVRYVVCTIPRGNPPGSTRWTNIPTLNAALPAVWDDLENVDGLTLVRCELRVLSQPSDHDPTEGINGLHPSDERGYIKLADALWPAFRNACGLGAIW